MKNDLMQMKEFYGVIKKSLQIEPTLVCYLDGFGYKLFENASAKGMIPFIRDRCCIEPIWSVEPPLTNPNMASMITGENPDKHGVLSKSDRELKVPTIFSECQKSQVLLEGDSAIMNTELKPLLHTSRKGHSQDYWIYKDTLKAIEKEIFFICAHFHGIDESEHANGPYSLATAEQLKELDAYLAEISDKFTGRMFLISDHGLHSVGNDGQQGDHGYYSEVYHLKPKQIIDYTGMKVEEFIEKHPLHVDVLNYVEDHLAIFGTRI